MWKTMLLISVFIPLNLIFDQWFDCKTSCVQNFYPLTPSRGDFPLYTTAGCVYVVF